MVEYFKENVDLAYPHLRTCSRSCYTYSYRHN